MPVPLPDNARELLTSKNLAHVATIMKSGRPQVSPVWVDVEGDFVIINSLKGRQKVINLEREPYVALSVADCEVPLFHTAIRGRVVETRTGDAAWADINKLSWKYVDHEYRQPGERVTYKIAVDHVYVRDPR